MRLINYITKGILILNFLLFLSFNCYSENKFDPQSLDTTKPADIENLLRDKYSNNLFLLTNEYIYTVTIDVLGSNITLPLIKDSSNRFTAWVPDSNYNISRSNALLINKQGQFVTSNFSIEPWNNKYDQELLIKTFSDALSISKDFITVGGISRKITLSRKNGSQVIEYDVKKFNDKINSANTNTLFDNIIILKNDINLQELAIKNIDAILVSKNTDESVVSKIAYMYSYLSEKNISIGTTKPTIKKVNINKTNTGLIIIDPLEYWLTEGAPVFDSKANLIFIYTHFY